MFPSDFVVKETLLSRPFLLLVSLVSAGCIGSKRIFQTIQKWFLLREFTRTLELQLFKHIDDIRLFGQRSLNGSSKSYMDREKFESLNLIFSVHRETCIVSWVEKKKKRKKNKLRRYLKSPLCDRRHERHSKQFLGMWMKQTGISKGKTNKPSNVPVDRFDANNRN